LPLWYNCVSFSSPPQQPQNLNHHNHTLHHQGYHGTVEGPRLQLVPAYVVSLWYIQAVLLGATATEAEASGWFAWLATTGVVQALLWATAAAACFMPVAKLSSGSGKFVAIGV
jgi:hypothetical protein